MGCGPSSAFAFHMTGNERDRMSGKDEIEGLAAYKGVNLIITQAGERSIAVAEDTTLGSGIETLLGGWHERARPDGMVILDPVEDFEGLSLNQVISRGDHMNEGAGPGAVATGGEMGLGASLVGVADLTGSHMRVDLGINAGFRRVGGDDLRGDICRAPAPPAPPLPPEPALPPLPLEPVIVPAF